jgi:hypothetical protein
VRRPLACKAFADVTPAAMRPQGIGSAIGACRNRRGSGCRRIKMLCQQLSKPGLLVPLLTAALAPTRARTGKGRAFGAIPARHWLARRDKR